MFARLHSGRSQRPPDPSAGSCAGVQRGATSNDDRVGRFGISFYDRAGAKVEAGFVPVDITKLAAIDAIRIENNIILQAVRGRLVLE